MNIQNTQVPFKQPTVETMVGNVKQDYPKPSVPPEDTDYTKIQSSEEDVVTQQATEDRKMNYEKSVNDQQGIPKQEENKLQEYTNQLAKDETKIDLKQAQADTREAITDYQNVLEQVNKQKGFDTYTNAMLGN